jgi:CRISPR-associated protein Csb2
MLALEIEFLLGRYCAADFRDRDRPEWPPHPARVFSALVAASYEAGLRESARAALLWLEGQPPPQISAPEAAFQDPVTAFVPVNDPSEDLLPTRLEKQPRSFPSCVPERPTVYLIWPRAEPDEFLRGMLGQIAEAVSYLGSSRSPVRVRLCDQPPEPTWVPDDNGAGIVRVARRGRLERLEWHYRNGLRPPPAPFQSYSRVGRPGEGAPEAQSVFGEMVLFRLAGPPRLEGANALKLTDALRVAVLALAGEDGAAIPDLLTGHGAHPHAAYVALPFVSERQRHADGHVLGAAVVFPRGVDAVARRQALRALARLRYVALAGIGRLTVERLTAAGAEPPANLRAGTWSAPAAVWTSATPVLLDRFPRRKCGAAEVIARSCADIGLPRPEEVAVSRFSPLFGAEPSARFLKVRRRGESARLSTHVTLAFDRPIAGPVLLGAGRYFGLGLLRPLRGWPAGAGGGHDS